MTTLAELYARIPSVDCKGLCAKSCGPIMCGEAEAALLPDVPSRRFQSPSGVTAVEIAHTEKRRAGQIEKRCVLLRNGRCTAYEVRPAICRLWGVAEGMRCPHGCVPERVVGRKEGAEILRAAIGAAA